MAHGGPLGFGRFTFADTGTPGSVRISLDGSFFQLNRFPVKGTDRLLTGELTLGWTIIRPIEVFAAYQNTSNSNRSSTPAIIQAQGDAVIGAKVGGPVGPFRLAGDLRGGLKNGLGADYLTAQTSDFEIRALGSTGGRAGEGSLQLELNLGFLIGKDKDALNPLINEQNSALLFGTGISGYYQFVAGLLLHYDLQIASPFLGVDFDEPLGVSVTNLRASKTTLGQATAKRLTAGVRIRTGFIGALDVGLTGGLGTGVIGFARTEPWLLTIAYSFGFDPAFYRQPPPPPPPAPPAPPKPVTVALRGTITDRTTSAPIFGVVVTPTGGLPVATGPDGSFVTRDLKPGPVELRFERDGYQGGAVTLTVNEQTAPIAVRLDPLPAAPVAPVQVAPPPAPPSGFIAGSLLGPDGGVQADIRISGTTSQNLRTNPDGSFSAKLLAGRYDVLALPDGFFARSASVTVSTDQVVSLVMRTQPRSKSGEVTLDNDAIKFAKAYALDEKRATPTPAQNELLAEVADIVVRNPDRKLVVSVHSDEPHGSSGDRIDWTEQRAGAIREALVAAGAPADRIDAHGLGTTQPIVPQTSREAAKQNRRVEMILVPIPATKVVPIVPVAPKPDAAPVPPPGANLNELPPMN